jgi:hypothetical protein
MSITSTIICLLPIEIKYYTTIIQIIIIDENTKSFN